MFSSYKSLLFAVMAFYFSPLNAQNYQLGAYYFPGWVDSTGEWWNPPWEKIKPFPEREPLLGWYPEKEVWVAEKHIDQAHSGGIDFFAYDWYWDGKKPFLNHAITAYLRARNRAKIKFCLLWANHTAVPESLNQFESMVDYWVTNYFKDPQYLTIQAKPVIIVFSPEHLRNNASKFGKTTMELFLKARGKAVENGLKGIYFVGCTQGNSYWVKEYMPKNGYDALTGYNYHSKPFTGEYTGKEPLATDYLQLLDGYRSQWIWTLNNSPLPYFIPVTAGWDRRPWGSNSAHDSCSSTPDLFREMLTEAKEIMGEYPEKTMKIMLIYAWNEFGEGGYIEPTKKWRFKYLQTVKNVFGK